MKTLLLIGDSVRKDYQPLVGRMLAGAVEVRGPEENCGDSRSVLAHLDDWVFSRPPDLVHINCGLHDIKRDFGQTRRAVPLAEYRRNVRDILARLVAANLAVIWASTTPVNEAWHHRLKPFDRMAADVDAYNAAAGAIAGELGVCVDDLHAAVMTAGRDRLLLPDGVHFNPDGRETQARAVVAAVRERLALSSSDP
jgi:lysophospholipase L1-like esterase